MPESREYDPAMTRSIRSKFAASLTVVLCLPVSLGLAGGGTEMDCNGNGIDDTQEIEQGTAVDCDFDGVPDECDIAVDPWRDCDGDGAIDRCGATYRGDDAEPETAFGTTNNSSLSFLWAKGFVVQPGLETIGAIEVCWRGWEELPDVAPGTAFTVGLLNDPNGDGKPNDASVLVSVDAIVAETEVAEFQVIEVPPTMVGTAGQTFFAAVYITVPPTTYPLCIDQDAPFDMSSWRKFFPAGQGAIGTVAELVELSTNGGPGDMLLHAVGVDAGATGPADLNCDGNVDAADLGVLLAAWGRRCDGCPEDLSNDGQIGGDDLGVLLGAW